MESEKIRKIEEIADLMDNLIKVPGTNYYIGLDGLLGLIPAIGDFITVLPALYIVYLSYKAGASEKTIGKMLMNIGIDAFIGTIPILGDVFDFYWKANERNVKLLHEEAGIIVQE